jgi:transposase
MDMTGNYKSLVKKLSPNAEVTVDIFPVIKRVQSDLNPAIIDQKKTAVMIKC